MKTRKDKLIHLKNFLNLETGEIDKEAFEYENTLYEKAIQIKSLNSKIRKCSLCEGMNIKRYTECVPGWGNLNSPVFFIGQSLHSPGVVSDIPFILGCGYILDAALRLSGLLRKDVFISNVLHGHPVSNRATLEEEKKSCLQYLKAEIGIVKPKLLVALGNDAQWSIDEMAMSGFCTGVSKVYCIKHPASFMYGSPELRIDWIIKLSLEIDKVYNG
jgi:uracil-DNA glycosylase family 4